MKTFKSKTLFLAGIYNLLFGIWACLFPSSYFSIIAIEPPQMLELWQCIGMIVGVYGIGYIIAAREPNIHWPIIFVGLLGKLFGLLGFIIAIIRETLPLEFGYIILTNDLIWWVPFAILLKKAKEFHFKQVNMP